MGWAQERAPEEAGIQAGVAEGEAQGAWVAGRRRRGSNSGKGEEAFLR